MAHGGEELALGAVAGFRGLLGLVQNLVGHFERPGALADHPFEDLRFCPRQLVELPFPGHGVGQLQHLHGVERLLQDHHAVALAEPLDDLVPRVVRVGRADDHLKLRAGLPQVEDRFHAVPSPEACGHRQTPARRAGSRPGPASPWPMLPGPGRRNPSRRPLRRPAPFRSRTARTPAHPPPTARCPGTGFCGNPRGWRRCRRR